MATHSSILAWKIPWTEEPGWLLFMGSQRVRHDWATELNTVAIKSMEETFMIAPWVRFVLSSSSIHSLGKVLPSLMYTTILLPYSAPGTGSKPASSEELPAISRHNGFEWKGILKMYKLQFCQNAYVVQHCSGATDLYRWVTECQ